MDVQRVQYVTQRYRQLQGLQLVPLAAVFLLSAMWRAGWFNAPLDGTIAAAWFVVGLTGALALSFAIRSWYTRTYGCVSQSMLESGVVPLVLLLIGFVIAIGLQERWHWPFSVPAMFVGTVCLVMGVSHGAIRQHYIAIAWLFFAFGTLGLVGVPFAVRDVALDVAIGVGLLIAGIGDHRLLRHTLRPAVR